MKGDRVTLGGQPGIFMDVGDGYLFPEWLLAMSDAEVAENQARIEANYRRNQSHPDGQRLYVRDPRFSDYMLEIERRASTVRATPAASDAVTRAVGIYQAAMAAHRPPTVTVAKTLKVSRSTASRLIREARDIGMLAAP